MNDVISTLANLVVIGGGIALGAYKIGRLERKVDDLQERVVNLTRLIVNLNNGNVEVIRKWSEEESSRS